MHADPDRSDSQLQPVGGKGLEISRSFALVLALNLLFCFAAIFGSPILVGGATWVLLGVFELHGGIVVVLLLGIPASVIYWAVRQPSPIRTTLAVWLTIFCLACLALTIFTIFFPDGLVVR